MLDDRDGRVACQRGNAAKSTDHAGRYLGSIKRGQSATPSGPSPLEPINSPPVGIAP
jgi:hypothetical protein